ncbi:MAG: Jag N-terminal domain-containing protein [Candidatus Dependentiae bacterium]|nr:Jag N-terminal domain-containing protein [Candidatus Dependentiae bacterium]
MKSIVEEASSIKQAIENGWKRLGEPTVFSVKILERPETGFFGFSTKSAKVALIVEDKTAPSQLRQQFKNEQPGKPLPAKKTYAAQAGHQEAQKKEIEGAEEISSKWSDQRVAIARDWLTNILKLMGKEHSAFETTVTDATLHIVFKSPLLPESKSERFVFASISHLMMETLRNKSKKILRNMRIMISSQ